MKTLYLAHPYGGDQANWVRAHYWLEWLVNRYDCAPVADWLLLVQIWKDGSNWHRKVGLEIDRAICMQCDVVALCGSMVSPGMTHETRDHRCKVDLTTLGLEHPPSNQFTEALRKADALMAAAGIERRHHNGR